MSFVAGRSTTQIERDRVRQMKPLSLHFARWGEIWILPECPCAKLNLKKKHTTWLSAHCREYFYWLCPCIKRNLLQAGWVINYSSGKNWIWCPGFIYFVLLLFSFCAFNQIVKDIANLPTVDKLELLLATSTSLCVYASVRCTIIGTHSMFYNIIKPARCSFNIYWTQHRTLWKGSSL